MRTACIIPAGGQGSRLSPHTRFIPKPLLPMGGSRLIDFALRAATSHADETYVSVWNHASLVREHVSGRQLDDVSVVDDSHEVGSAGLLIQNAELFDEVLQRNDLLLVLPADHVWVGLPAEKLLRTHAERHWPVTQLLFSSLKPYGHYAWVDPQGRVERVGYGVTSEALTTTGIMVFDTSFVIRWLSRREATGNTKVGFYEDLFLSAVEGGEAGGAIAGAGYWDDAGTVERYWENALMFSDGKSVLDDGCRVDESTNLVRSVAVGACDLRGVVARDSVLSANADGTLAITNLGL